MTTPYRSVNSRLSSASSGALEEKATRSADRSTEPRSGVRARIANICGTPPKNVTRSAVSRSSTCRRWKARTG